MSSGRLLGPDVALVVCVLKMTSSVLQTTVRALRRHCCKVARDRADPLTVRRDSRRNMPMVDEPNLRACFLCRQIFTFGPKVYAGKHVHQWGEHVCNSRLATNWDGIVPEAWPHAMSTQEAKGVELKRNSQGWIEIPS